MNKNCVLLFFLPILFVVLTSCNNKEVEPENDIIERQQFVEMIVEVQILESTHQFIKSKRIDFNPDFNYLWLYKKHKVTEEKFLNSIDYYASDPQVFEEIYDEVIIKISEKQVEFTERPVK